MAKVKTDTIRGFTVRMPCAARKTVKNKHAYRKGSITSRNLKKGKHSVCSRHATRLSADQTAMVEQVIGENPRASKKNCTIVFFKNTPVMRCEGRKLKASAQKRVAKQGICFKTVKATFKKKGGKASRKEVRRFVSCGTPGARKTKKVKKGARK